MSVAMKLAAVQERVAQACLDAGRAVDEITLVAASKGHAVASVAAASQAGQVHFGESYAQELNQKVGELGARSGRDGGPVWHFIGRLQRNKAKRVVGTASLIHAVDSERLAAEISKRAGLRPQPILLAVNLAGEVTKSGLAPNTVLALAKIVNEMPGVELQGLMAMPPWYANPEDCTPHFQRLSSLAQEGRSLGLGLNVLSMGMSHDFHVAIREGATHIRVGTAIFGPRV